MSLISEVLNQMVYNTPTISSATTKEISKDTNKSSFQNKTKQNTLNQIGLAIKRR